VLCVFLVGFHGGGGGFGGGGFVSLCYFLLCVSLASALTPTVGTHARTHAQQWSVTNTSS
jgi:hypothetical protein